MKINETQKFKLRKFVKELDSFRRTHTELITVYVPSGYDLTKIIQHLQQEQGTASNIKSSSTKKNVIAGLEKMIQHLRLFKKTPENGLAVFSGNVAEREGQEDFKVWSMEPPLPLNTRIYRCDKNFILDLLVDLLEDKQIYGLIVLDRRDANIAMLKGKSIIPVLKTHSQVPGKMRAGGQSSQRFARIREGAIKDHFKKIADHVKDQFLGKKELKGIIVGGPGPSKYDFVEGNFLTAEIKNKIIGIKDLSYTAEFGLQELVDKSQDLLADEDIAQEKKVMQRFFDLLNKKPGMVAYGEKEVAEKLKMGAVDLLLVSETVEDSQIEAYEEEGEKSGCTLKIISTETREGAQLKEMGGVVAILRYVV